MNIITGAIRAVAVAYGMLNYLFGIAWIPAVVIVILGLIDYATGSFIKLMFLDVLNLDNYQSLLDKYTDQERETFRAEREYAYGNYQTCLAEMLQERQFRRAWDLKKAHGNGDYLELYFQIAEWEQEA